MQPGNFMDERLRKESECLMRSWMQHEPEMLNTYLIGGVEDPRINVQSILTRHFLTVALFGSRFEALLEHELRFALVMNWLAVFLEQAGGPEDLRAIAHALDTGAESGEGWAIPGYVAATARMLPATVNADCIPNYLAEVLGRTPASSDRFFLDERVLNTFQHLWAVIFQRESVPPVSVLEPACGSANDYRFLESYGLARFLEYTGFDLCLKNVDNARRMFPQARFEVGNVFELPWPNTSFDYCFIHDLFEHLSPEGVEAALAELCRVTRQGISIGFFNLHEADEHIIRSLDEYHWNTLSVALLRQSLERRGFTVQIVHLDTFLRWRFGCDQTHNKNAYTFLAERSGVAQSAQLAASCIA
jgi:ubiquinone/menaquinone biosynthesis C-methylase UbiE